MDLGVAVELSHQAGEITFILDHFLVEGFLEQTAVPLVGFIDRFCIGAE